MTIGCIYMASAPNSCKTADYTLRVLKTLRVCCFFVGNVVYLPEKINVFAPVRLSLLPQSVYDSRLSLAT